MFDLDNWNEIWVTITRNKLRSILTGFGVFWGIFMLVILLGGGRALEGGISKNFGGFATNSSFYYTNKTSEAYKGYRKGRTWHMNNRDLTLIKERATSVEYISPMLWGNQSDKNVVLGQKSGNYSVIGIYPEHFYIQTQNYLSGRNFNQLDIKGSRKTCVIGKEVYETLFKIGEVAEGQYIRVNGVYFQVIGVVSPKSENISIGGNPKESVFIPFTTMQTTFNQGDVIHFLACTTKPGYEATFTQMEVNEIIKGAHSISPTDEKALGGFNVEQEFKMFDMLFMGIGILIWFVGISTLFSGMIGISNIMLVTVKERTREIGVRRALGAKPMTILVQILSESFVLTLIAGIFGLFAGIAALEIVNKVLDDYFLESNVFIAPFVPFNVAVVSLIILIFSGILAGIMPAMRALRVKAIDAIRDE